ncbi:MAG: hypothetical protein HQ518_23835 [Rhodopirellula sp.]|nr:hypothetical protein [Rhodopirellula sp.]
MSIRIGCVLLLVVTGCRGAIDQQIDRLTAAGITVKQNSAGDVFRVDTAGVVLDEHFWESLSNFEQLEQLALTGSPVTDRDLPQLTSLRTLRSLDLSYTRVSSSGLSILSRVEDLQTLSLNGVSLDAAAVEPLSQLTRLRSLSLIDSDISAEDVESVKHALPRCLVVQ